MSTILLIKVLADPKCIQAFSIKEWELCIRQARTANLLARLHATFIQYDLIASIPEKPLSHLQASTIKARRHQEQVVFEINELSDIFTTLNIPAIILKGAAYVVNDNLAKCGRTSNDIDILVEKSQLNHIERSLCERLWSKVNMEDYDQAYYRTWMHEIPPLIHIDRKTILDIHHNILPPTSAIKVNAPALLANKQSLNSFSNCFTLAPEDMLLHSATHLFNEGELSSGLRDLTDLQLLFIEFSQQDENFYHKLLTRADEIGLTKPLFLATRYCQLILKQVFPEEFCNLLALRAPKSHHLLMLDFIFLNSFTVYHSSCVNTKTSLANFLLYIRGHLLRMPLKLLLPHLVTKAKLRLKEIVSGEKYSS